MRVRCRCPVPVPFRCLRQVWSRGPPQRTGPVWIRVKDQVQAHLDSTMFRVKAGKDTFGTGPNSESQGRGSRGPGPGLWVRVNAVNGQTGVVRIRPESGTASGPRRGSENKPGLNRFRVWARF